MSDYCDSDESSGEPYFYLREDVRRGDFDAVQGALDEGRSPNEIDSDNGDYTLLHWAAGMTDEDNLWEVRADYFNILDRRRIVKLLLDRGAEAWRIWWQEGFFGDHSGQRPWDLTEDRETIMMIQKACVQQVLKSIRDRNELSREAKGGGLVAAASLNMVEAVREIHQAGAETDDDSCDVTALSVASANGHIGAVRALVQECGANVDHDVGQRGTTALRVAAEAGEHGVVEFLLEQGADQFLEEEFCGPLPMFVESVPVRNTLLTHMHIKIQDIIANNNTESSAEDAVWSKNYQVKTAFHVFIAFGYNEGLHTLLNSGITQPPNSLQTAIAFGQIDTLELLLAGGAIRTYDAVKKVNFYGDGSRRPRDHVVIQCQQRLDETIAAAEEWNQLANIA